MALLLHFLRPGDLFLDVGANIGSYTILASGVVRATSWAFEPDPQTSRYLRRNVAINGLCVDLVAQNQLGRTNAVIWASKIIGAAIGGGAFYAMTTSVSWTTLLIIMAVAIWALTAIPLLIPERSPSERAISVMRRLELNEVRRTFSIPGVWLGLVIAFVIPMGYGLLGTPFQFLLRDELKWSEGSIGLLTAVIDPLMGVLGSLTGGFLTDRLGARRIITVASLGMAVAMGTLGLLPDYWHSSTFMFAWYAVHFCVQYLFGAALLAFFMSLSNPAIGATHIGIYFSLNNLCYTFCDWGGGKLLALNGYSVTFLICCLVQMVALAPLLMCEVRRVRERFLIGSGGTAS